jgi:hypothetical protein
MSLPFLPNYELCQCFFQTTNCVHDSPKLPENVNVSLIFFFWLLFGPWGWFGHPQGPNPLHFFIFCFLALGVATPMGHGDGSATPRPAKWVAQPPLFFFFFFFVFIFLVLNTFICFKFYYFQFFNFFY